MDPDALPPAEPDSPPAPAPALSLPVVAAYNPSPLSPEAPTAKDWMLAKPWYWQWSRGWRLGIVIAGVIGLASAYVLWRGPNDYQSLKGWRARGLAAKALEAASQGSPDKAKELIEKALTLAPRDGAVIRTVADLGESSQDEKTLLALRHLISLELAKEADLERLCRLAFDWGRPEMASGEMIRRWATSPAEQLGVIQLEATARWFASRGLESIAEDRLRRAIALADPADSDSPRINLALGELLTSRSDGPPTLIRLQEAKARWMDVARNTRARPAHQAQALRGIVGLFGLKEAELLRTAEAIAEIRAIAETCRASAPAASKMSFRLIVAELDLMTDPTRGTAIADSLVAEAQVDSTGAIDLCRWLVIHGATARALTLCEEVGQTATDRDWFIAKLDAFFAQQSWDEVAGMLEAPSQPLSPLFRALFLFRNDLAAGRDAEILAPRREALLEAATRAEAADIRFAAGNLEMAGQTELAITLYQHIRHHQELGLTGLLGMIRCLGHHPDRTSELIEALEGILKILPDSQEARADLIYLRFLTGPPTADDITQAKALVTESPQFLGYRVVAALAALQSGRPTEALATIDGAALPWDQVRPGWRAVYASVLAANGQPEQARSLAQAIKREQLRLGERKLLEQHQLIDP